MRKIFTLFVAALCCATMFAEDYALPGKFTINAEGGQVQFHYAFMMHRSDETYTTWYPPQMRLGVIEDPDYFFSWGTGDNPNNWGAVNNFVDWGDNLCCDIEPHIWRTMSANEWLYLLSGREHAEYLCGLAKVSYQGKDIKVLMLFPDDIYNGDSNDGLNLPDGLTFASYKNVGNKFTCPSSNAYTYEEWTKLEEAGAVVFPETGVVEFEPVPEHGKYDFPNYRGDGYKRMYCWTSTPYLSGYAMALFIEEGSTFSNALAKLQRDFPCPVRLVKDVKNTEGIENIATPADKARKVMMDGTLYIATPDGKIYNATGVEVK